MAYINPQIQINQQENARNDRNMAAIGNGLVGGLSFLEENRRRALDQQRLNAQLELQKKESGNNEKLFQSKLNELAYQEDQRKLDPMMRDDFRQKEALAKIEAQNDMRKLGMQNQNAIALKNVGVTAKGPTLSSGEEAIDKNYADQYNNFTGKGINNTEFTIKKLEEIAAEMEGDTGVGEAGGTRFPIPDMLRSRDAIRRRDETRNAANSTLKELFGGQLSDGERIAAAKEYYNDELDNETNAKILRDKISQLKANREAEIERSNYFRENRTLKGFAPKTNRVKETKEGSKFLDTTKKMSDQELMDAARQLGVIK